MRVSESDLQYKSAEDFCMNSTNETFATGKMIREMEHANVDHGYKTVPSELVPHARRQLRGRAIATFDKKTKKKIRQLNARRREQARRDARNSPVVLAQLAALQP